MTTLHIDDLPLDVLRIVWRMCQGYPLKFVSKKWWARLCIFPRVAASNVRIAGGTLDAQGNNISSSLIDKGGVNMWMMHTPSLIQWAIPMGLGSSLSSSMCTIAAYHGDIELRKWMTRTYSNTMYTEDEAIIGARRGHLPYLQYLWSENGSMRSTYVLRSAIECGHLEIVQWIATLYTMRHLKQKNAMLHAARNGQTLIMDWLITQDNAWLDDIATQAVNYDQVNVLKWMVKHTRPFPANLHMDASRSGALKCFAWLREKGMVNTAHVCLMARNACMNFRHEFLAMILNTYEIDPVELYAVIDLAITGQALKCLNVLVNKYGMRRVTANAYRDAIRAEAYDTLKWLLENKVEPEESIYDVACSNTSCKKSVRWLWKHKIPYRSVRWPNLFTNVVRSGDIDALIWIKNNTPFTPDDDTFQRALDDHADDVIEWLLVEYPHLTRTIDHT